MRTRHILLTALLALASASAQAATAQVVLDITPTAAQTGQHDGWGLSYSQDFSVALQPFSMVVRFDLDNPTIANTRYSHPGWHIDNSTSFNGAAASATPHTPRLRATLPDSEPTSPESTSVYFNTSLWTRDAPDVPHATTDDWNVRTNVAWESADEAQSLLIDYTLALRLDAEGGPLLASQAVPVDGAAMLNWLDTQTGKTFANAFRERHLLLARQTIWNGEGWSPLGNPDAVLSWQESVVWGDVQIRSVSVVPEPAATVLLGTGLLTLALAARARWAPRRMIPLAS